MPHSHKTLIRRFCISDEAHKHIQSNMLSCTSKHKWAHEGTSAA